MNAERRSAVQQDIAERSYLQWRLKESLGTGVLSWMVFSALLFILDEKAAFLTLVGSGFFFSGLFFVAPSYGIFLYLTNKIVFYQMKRMGRLPRSLDGFRKTNLIIKGIWLPALFYLTLMLFGLYYDTIASMADAGQRMLGR